MNRHTIYTYNPNAHQKDVDEYNDLVCRLQELNEILSQQVNEYYYALSQNEDEEDLRRMLLELDDLEAIIAEVNYRLESGLYKKPFHRKNYHLLDGYLLETRLNQYENRAEELEVLITNAKARYTRFKNQGVDTSRVLHNLSKYTAEYDELGQHMINLIKIQAARG